MRGEEKMMKKLFIVLLSALMVFGFLTQARAETSTSAYTGKRYEEQQVFVMAFNNSGSTLNTTSVVILDLSGTGVTAGATLGSYVTTTTTADSVRVFGVADESIDDQSVGRICIRGPHQVRLVATSSPSSIGIGDLITTSATAGRVAEYSTADGTAGGVLGRSLETTTNEDFWIWVNPEIHK